MASYTVISDEYVNELFEGTNFGEPTNNCVLKKREQIAKNLRDQLNGYWSGHTAYHILIDGKFLKDAKSNEKKEPTALGVAFLQEMEGQQKFQHYDDCVSPGTCKGCPGCEGVKL